jgi:nucleoside-diphosphate-sugar epimerase
MWIDALAAHGAGHVRVMEARASDFYGPGVRATGHLGEQFVPRLLAGRIPPVMQGEVDAAHCWTYVDDIARNGRLECGAGHVRPHPDTVR